MNGGKREEISLVGSLAAILVAVVAVSIVWAVYTSRLTIARSSSTIKAGNWSIVFSDLIPITRGNSGGVGTTVEEKVAPTLSETTITGFQVDMKTPGDWFSYKFKINNTGKFPAKITTFSKVDSSYIACEPATSSRIEAEKAAALCSHINIKLRYTDTKADVKTDDAFAVGASKEVELYVEYDKDLTTEEAPEDDVTVTIREISIPFAQVTA